MADNKNTDCGISIKKKLPGLGIQSRMHDNYCCNMKPIAQKSSKNALLNIKAIRNDYTHQQITKYKMNNWSTDLENMRYYRRDKMHTNRINACG